VAETADLSTMIANHVTPIRFLAYKILDKNRGQGPQNRFGAVFVVPSKWHIAGGLSLYRWGHHIQVIGH